MTNSEGTEVTASAAATVLESERMDLEQALEVSRKAGRRHTLWAALGASPGAAIPLFLSVDQAGMVGLVVATLAVAGVETWRAIKANRRTEELQAALRELGSDPHT